MNKKIEKLVARLSVMDQSAMNIIYAVMIGEYDLSMADKSEKTAIAVLEKILAAGNSRRQ